MDARRPNTEQNRPIIHIEVAKKNVGEIADLKPGDEVRVVLVGNVTEVVKRDSEQMGLPGHSGTLVVEVTSMKARKQDNPFSDLADDEDA